MKKKIFFIASLFIVVVSWGQTQDYRVVFDMTSRDTIDHKMVIHWIHEVQNANKDAQVEVVFFGQSLDMVVKDRSIIGDEITNLAKDSHVKFSVCSIAMKSHHIEPGQLVAGVTTVPDGIYEIISKQRQGWGYIKVSH